MSLIADIAVTLVGLAFIRFLAYEKNDAPSKDRYLDTHFTSRIQVICNPLKMSPDSCVYYKKKIILFLRIYWLISH